MGSDNSNPKKARIESLWAMGRGTHAIAKETGAALEYVQYVVRLIQAHSRAIRPATFDNDDDKHLRLIIAKHGAGFPYFARVPI